MLMCIQNLVKFCPLVLKILSGNEILTSIKGHNSVVNLRILTLYNPNLDIIYINVYTTFGKILSIGSQDIEWKRNPNLEILSIVMCIQNFVKFCPLVLKILSGNEIPT